MTTTLFWQRLFILVKREYWEHRLSFLYLPVATVVMICVAFIVSLVRMQMAGQYLLRVLPEGGILFGASDSPVEAGAAPTIPPEFIATVFDQLLTGASQPLFMAYWLVLMFYFLMTLYQQRKDRSVLFWNSLPISDTQTILSKLLAGFGLCLVIYLLCIAALQLLLLIIASVYGMQFDIDIWSTFWEPAHYLERMGRFTLSLAVGIGWSLPVFASMLLASAWARSAPFAWVCALPVVAIVFEMIVYRSKELLLMLGTHSFPIWILMPRPAGDGYQLYDAISAELLISFVIGIALILAAIRLNRVEVL